MTGLFLVGATTGDLPDYCESFPTIDVTPKYEVRLDADQLGYCEGILPRPIAHRAVPIVSVKQAGGLQMIPEQQLKLSWCADASLINTPVHIKLRAVRGAPADYAVDAKRDKFFNWPTTLVRHLIKEWALMGALASADMKIGDRSETVLVPIKSEDAARAQYSFLINNNAGVVLSRALLEPVEPTGEPILMSTTVASGPAATTELRLDLALKPIGIYRLTFGERSTGAGVTTEPIYFLHGCQ